MWCYTFAGFAVNGDICIRSGRRNPLEKGRNVDEFDESGLEGNRRFPELTGFLMWLANQTRPDTADAMRAVARSTDLPTKVHCKIVVGIFDFVGILSWNT